MYALSDPQLEGERGAAVLARAAEVVRRRLEALEVTIEGIAVRGEQLVIELGAATPEMLDRAQDVIGRTARLEFRVVDATSPFVAELIDRVKRDAGAAARGITVEDDLWHLPSSHGYRQDWRLVAADREQRFGLEDAQQRGCYHQHQPVTGGTVECSVRGRQVLQEYLDEVLTRAPALQPETDRQFLFQREQRPGAPQVWRSYYVHAGDAMAGVEILDVEVVEDPGAGGPAVIVRLDPDGARRFEELTSQIVGDKLAIVLDTVILMAPVVMSTVPGGSVMISLGQGDPEHLQLEARNLAVLLRAGALPAPLLLEDLQTLDPR